MITLHVNGLMKGRNQYTRLREIEIWSPGSEYLSATESIETAVRIEGWSTRRADYAPALFSLSKADAKRLAEAILEFAEEMAE